MAIGKVTNNLSPGKVQDASARFSPAQWEAVKNVRGPGPNDWPGYGFWFNYFWDEAVTVPDLNNADKQMLVETLHGVFTKVGLVWQLRTDAQSREDYHRLKMLRNLLHIGFVRVPYETGGPKRYQPNPATDAPSLFAEIVNIDRPGGGQSRMKIGWRSDSRPYEMLVQQNGFQARARQDGTRSEWNLDKPWHPYSLDVYKDAIYLRKGQNRDNCLHTAVSVGTDFKQLVHFPILTDASLYTLPDGPITQTIGSTVVVNAKGQVARIATDQHGKYLEHDTQLYAVRIDPSMSGYHTQEFQRIAGKDPFPERSVDAVPLSNIVALVVVTRKYWWNTSYGDKSQHRWQIFDVDCKEIQILNPFLLKMVYGPEADTSLEQHTRTQVSQAKQRSDFTFASVQRIKELSTPRGPQMSTSNKHICGSCGQEFRMAILLRNHKSATGH